MKNDTAFGKGQKVRCISNPFGAMLPVGVGQIGTITDGGTAIVGVQFGKIKVAAWMVKDAKGNATIEAAK